MIKKPIFYPVLTREKHGKIVRTPGTLTSSSPVLIRRDADADRLIKSTRQYFPNYINSHSSSQYETNQRAGVNQPGWHQAVAKGVNATSVYDRRVTHYKQPSYRVTSEDAGNLSNGYGTWDGPLNLIEKDYTPLITEATARLKHKLDGNIGKAQLAAPLAESREIHRLVRQINNLTLDTLKALLAIRKTRGRSALKQFGNIWLGFGFGVNPMLKDIESAANSILDFTTREDRHVRIVGTSSRDYQSALTTTSPQQIAVGCNMGFHSSFLHTQGVRIVAGVDLKIRSAASYSVLDHLGLKVTDLPSALWELTPYSWAVDYFVTIGPWLSDMFYTIPGVTKYISLNRKYQVRWVNEPYPIPSAGFKVQFVGSNGVGLRTQFSRESLTALNSRGVQIKSLDEIANHGLTKILNLASILAQRWGPNL